ncbi:hsp90 co-chaperone Cdc37-like 1 isoform X3 [Electrophorus electricus]|uniref:hsp90 co-chaperone Cdc37-like 1 isoform X3 n=1 Tax=Electrophorus electricus TaxID=8005 RepID=UPI0015D0CD20|nr:hsp90 co-chaperone Cdc37-like 1 isoform X3 [Electrophorus electricus]
MEWFMFPDEQSRTTGNPNLASHSEVPQASVENMVSLCESQQQYVKASIVSHWQLVEAQDQLGGLELHSSESAEQAHARALASSAHISQAEQEWRLKESMLGVEADPRCSPVLGPEVDRGGFDRSIINDPLPSEADSDNSLPFVQRHEQHLKHFGMLHRWDDSQHFLAQFPHIIREETANYLILWCFRLYAENKGALMEQVAHQAVAMQFILEMARNTQQDPRGCFRQFFQKAKELKACIQSQDMHILQNVLSTMNPQVAEYHIKRCLEAGLCATPGRGPKEDDWETEELKMMEMS